MGPDDGAPASELGSLAHLLRKVAATPGGDAPLAPQAQLAQRYTVVRFLGRGGMGSVYAVRDSDLDELVALKLLHADLGTDAGYQQRLRAEVRLARRVSHPNVCRVHDLGHDSGRLFVTMELVEGRSLRELARAARAGKTPLPSLATIVDFVVQIAAALGAAHRAGVLHRDVKPDNVVVDGSRAVLTDFGVASLAHDRDDVIAGTPAYMAPEILRGEPFDQRADVYSAGVLAYELVTGRLPFASRSLDAARKLASERTTPPPVPELLGPPALRAALDRAFGRALDSDPLARLASAEHSRDDRHAPQREHDRGTRRGTGAHDRRPTVDASDHASTLRRRGAVATVLVYRADRLRMSSQELRVIAPDVGGEFPTLPMGALVRTPAESLERIVVDAGGSPIAVSGLEITALFGAPVSLGDDAERAARAAQALIAHRGGRAGLDTVRFAMRPGVMALSASDATRSATALANAAEAGQVLASPLTARQIAARFDLEAIQVGATAARRIVGERPPVPRPDAATFRARELEALEALRGLLLECRPRHGEVAVPPGRKRGCATRDPGCAAGELVDSSGPRGRRQRTVELLRIADPACYARPPVGSRRRPASRVPLWLEGRRSGGRSSSRSKTCSGQTSCRSRSSTSW